MSAVWEVFGSGLEHRVAVYMPGTTRVDQGLPANEHDRWVSVAAEFLSGLFGGATTTRVNGWWVTEQGNLVSETVTVIYAFCSDLSLTDLQAVRQLAELVKLALEQESVAVEIDGELFFV